MPRARSAATEPEVLFDQPDCLVTREVDLVRMDHSRKWSSRDAALARKYGINALTLAPASLADRASLDFLRDLPPLLELHAVLPRPMNLRAITEITTLRYLGMMGDIVSPRHDAPADVDLTSLSGLKRAYVFLCPPILSILDCATLEDLWIWNAYDPPLDLLLKPRGKEQFRAWEKHQHTDIDLARLPKLRTLHLTQCCDLRDLDLTHQPALASLHIEASPKLRDIKFHPKAKLRSLKVGSCGPYRIDWSRLGPDLHHLDLSGRPPFPFEDVRHASNLRTLQTNGIRKFPPLRFLLDLPHLHDITLFTTPPGPTLTADDHDVVRTINGRSKR